MRRERTRISEQCPPISLTFTAVTHRFRLTVRLSTSGAGKRQRRPQLAWLAGYRKKVIGGVGDKKSQVD